MNVICVDHIGIAVKNLDETIKFYEETLGVKCSGIEEVDEQKVRVAFMPLGDAELEFLESTSPEGPIARFIDKNGEGIQHLALRVDDIEGALKEMEEKGVRMIDVVPRYGAGNSKIAFLHPKGTKGVLLELAQRMK